MCVTAGEVGHGWAHGTTQACTQDQDDSRYSGSQAEVRELWFSWGEWNCAVNLPEGWQDVRAL